MKDLWSDLASRVRAANRAPEPEVPFGFADAVLRKLRAVGPQRANLLDDWLPVLRPAVGLAFGTALLCVLLQLRLNREMPNDTLTYGTETEALIQLAVLND